MFFRPCLFVYVRWSRTARKRAEPRHCSAPGGYGQPFAFIFPRDWPNVFDCMIIHLMGIVDGLGRFSDDTMTFENVNLLMRCSLSPRCRHVDQRSGASRPVTTETFSIKAAYARSSAGITACFRAREIQLIKARLDAMRQIHLISNLGRLQSLITRVLASTMRTSGIGYR